MMISPLRSVALSVCLFLVLLTGGCSKKHPGRSEAKSEIADGAQTSVPGDWITVGYGNLLDPNEIIRTGQRLPSAVKDPHLRAAVQPFVDRFSALLQPALEMIRGPDKLPYRDVAEFFPHGSPQPAWVALARGGRLFVSTDENGHARLFLPGDDPQQAYALNYSIVRHALALMVPVDGSALSVEIFAYQNRYETSELLLNLRPYEFKATSFNAKKSALDLGRLAGFIASGCEIEGATLRHTDGFVLYGKTSLPATLAQNKMDLSDLAVAYRAVFHAGDNAAFVSLDPHSDPTKVTVNFGGFLEDTRVGSVVLEADKRFKTITSGLDPNSHKDQRGTMRAHLSSFFSAGERELGQGDFSGRGTWIGTRFWYYPDAIGVDADLNNEYAVITNPRFTADAERSREDFRSRDDFERMKRERLSPAIRESIDDLNANYPRYATAFPELQELCTVARLMGICSWLAKAKVNWLDFDELLRVQLPACETEKERTQLMAATIAYGEGKHALSNAGNAQVVFLGDLLDKTVADYFPSPESVALYLQAGKEHASPPDPFSEAQAEGLFTKYRNKKVRDMIASKEQVQKLVYYAASRVPKPKEAAFFTAKTALTAQRGKLERVSAQVEQAKRLRPAQENPNYNRWVDAYNTLIDQQEAERNKLNALVDLYNSQAGAMHTTMILEIGGGINLEPESFAVRSVRSSEKLDAFKGAVSRSSPPSTNNVPKLSLINSRDALPMRVADTKRIGKAWIFSSPADGSSSASSKTSAKADDGRAVWAVSTASGAAWRECVVNGKALITEKSYDGEKKELQVAKFAGKRLESLIVGTADSPRRITFHKSERHNVLPPQNPPAWYSSGP